MYDERADTGIKLKALELALQRDRVGENVTPEDTVATAKAYERYLKGCD